MQANAATAAPADVVLYAADAANLHGNWTRIPDATGAGGQMMSSVDRGWSTDVPLSGPTNYFDFTFSAPANTAYHVWMRLRAASNSKWNDSLFAQFSDARDTAGAPVFALGSTTALVVNLAADPSGKTIKGWGWTSGAYWVTQSTTVTFATTGSHTLRIQTREDGVQLDQVVLSPSNYLTTAPGPATADTTIVPKPITIVSAPGVPGSQSPANAATGVATATTLSWSAAGATSYDLRFGTTNAPPPMATGLTAASYAVTGLVNGTTYFWQIIARNDIGSTAGPIWSFTTTIGPPGMPVVQSPANGATGVAISSSLSWSATGATSYDVKFGTTNPPPAVASGLTTSSYAPAGMTNGSTYFWQIVARNAIGSTTGAVWSFTTAAAPPPSTTVPLSYSAITDRVAYGKPALPALGAAGFRFTDPTFGSRMVRISDANTRPGTVGRSYDTPSAAHQTAWNTNSTYFYIRSTDGAYIPYAFDASTMTAARIRPSGTGDGGLTIYSNTEPQFSYVSPNILYGAIQDATNDWPILRQYDFSTGVYTNLLNLGTVATIAQHTYAGGLSSSAGSPEKLIAFYGGSQQDAHYLATVFVAGSTPVTVNTLNSTVTTNGVQTATNITLNFHLHHALVDKSGRYVILETTGPDRQSPRYAAPKYVWDTATNAFTALDNAVLPNGHYSAGFGVMINHDCCTATAWDGAQFQMRSLATPAVTSDLIKTVLTPKEIYLDDHNSWNNAQADTLVPFLSGFYRYGDNTTAWRAWDDEIVAVQTGAGAADATVWRFAHHRSDTKNEADPLNPSFWYEPRPSISQDGRWAIFTSNWEKTLGTDPSGGWGASYRQDVFLIELKP
jgi:hypothetical protein